VAVRERPFALDCRDCPRLAAYLDDCRTAHPDYHAKPVAPFGAARPRLLIVGLAPGMHGANRSGRPFTGDYAGVVLYPALHRHGYASGPESVHTNDGLRLQNCRITNAVKCVPPGNKPTPAEIRQCNGYLRAELAALPRGAVILALGRIAHEAVLLALALKPSAHAFGHGARHALPDGVQLFDSYHCSRYNINTRRLTPAMFDEVMTSVRQATDRAA
jgi:uracil-DNA glycosylase family 4